MVSERASERAFFCVSALLFAASAAADDRLEARPCRRWAVCRCPAAGRCRWRGCGCPERPDCRGVVPRHVGRDDGGDDAAVPGSDAVALPPRRRQAGPDAARSADCGLWERVTSWSGSCSEWSCFPWASRWRRSKCGSQQWRAAFRSRSAWSSLIAGALQFTQWKARCLACCREAPGRGKAAGQRRRGLATRPEPRPQLLLPAALA